MRVRSGLDLAGARRPITEAARRAGRAPSQAERAGFWLGAKQRRPRGAGVPGQDFKPISVLRAGSSKCRKLVDFRDASQRAPASAQAPIIELAGFNFVVKM